MMRLTFTIFCLCLLSGCESVSERVSERFADAPARKQVFATDARTAYFGAQMAFKRLDFRLTQTHPRQIEAAGRIRHSEAFADSRQLVAQVQIREISPGQTEVSMQLTEEVENASLGGPSVQALRNHGFYDTYYSVLQQVIDDGSAAAEAKNN